MASSQLSWNYGRNRQDPWHLSRALIYHSSAATLADQVAASDSPGHYRYQANGMEGCTPGPSGRKQPQGHYVETIGKAPSTCASPTASGRDISVYLKRYHDVAAAGEQAGAATARARSSFCYRMGI